ncbi:MAG: phosphorylase family protein [Gaiellaceae bacterium]
MPIHVIAGAGDYAETCLLPGDPLRARLISERFLNEAVQVTGARGLLGYTGSFEGKPVSVQATGMGGPSAAIVVEELAQLGVRTLVRVGTCGSLRPGLEIGELVVPLAAFPADGTTRELAGEPHAPCADWELLHGLVHAAKQRKLALHVGPIATSDLFYDPDEGQNERWARLGALAVEMECAALFTLAALRSLRAAAILIVTDELAGAKRRRVGDAELPAAVEQAALLALAAATGGS